jgi:pimeloyl-ACP methyl ester carboxylesterase
MREARVPAGVIEYDDTGGDGPVLVFLHGLLMDHTTWRHVVPSLRDDYRCITPTLPLGSHRQPMRPDAALDLRGMVHLVADFLDVLDVRDVTMISVDWGGGLFLTHEGRDARVARWVICPSEAYDNAPPGIPGTLAALAARIPGGIHLALQQMRIPWLRNSPLLLGALAKRPIPDDIVRGWIAPGLASKEIRRDVAKYARRTWPKADLVAATEALGAFAGPTLVVWAPDATMMPAEHGRRLADLIPQARLVEIPDSHTLVNEDQPEVLVGHLRQFLAETDVRLHWRQDRPDPRAGRDHVGLD